MGKNIDMYKKYGFDGFHFCVGCECFIDLGKRHYQCSKACSEFGDPELEWRTYVACGLFKERKQMPVPKNSKEEAEPLSSLDPDEEVSLPGGQDQDSPGRQNPVKEPKSSRPGKPQEKESADKKIPGEKAKGNTEEDKAGNQHQEEQKVSQAGPGSLEQPEKPATKRGRPPKGKKATVLQNITRKETKGNKDIPPEKRPVKKLSKVEANVPKEKTKKPAKPAKKCVDYGEFGKQLSLFDL